MFNSRTLLLNAFAFCFLISFFLLCILIGEQNFSLLFLSKSLNHHLFGQPLQLNRIDDHILWYLRIPRALMALLSGAGLSLCSAILQTILRNPLSEPYLLGINSGASFGIVLTVLFGLSTPLLSLTVGAFIGAIFAFSLILFFLFFLKQSSFFILLLGLSLGQFFNALTAFCLWRYGDIEIRGQIYDWFLGSFTTIGWTEILFLTPIFFVSFVLFLKISPFLDAFLLGQDSVKALGFSTKKFIFFVITLLSLLSAAIVASIGTVGFIGLISPHIARFIVGPKHQPLLLMSGFVGAILMCASDILSRILITGFPIPIGVITALLCAPIFIILLVKNPVYASYRY